MTGREVIARNAYITPARSSIQAVISEAARSYPLSVAEIIYILSSILMEWTQYAMNASSGIEDPGEG